MRTNTSVFTLTKNLAKRLANVACVADFCMKSKLKSELLMPSVILPCRSVAAFFALVFSLFGANVAYAQSSACVAGETTQNFVVPAGAWPAGSTGPLSFTVGTGANAVTMTFTITNAIAFTAPTPNQAQHGGLPDVVRTGHTTPLINTSLSTQTITFSRPINKFVYVATDVDFITGQWQDVVVARANGTLLPTSMVGGAGHTIDIATGTVTATTSLNCLAADPACNVRSNFDFNGITSASEEFRSGPLHTGAGQFLGWTSFGFCAPNIEPDLSLVKDDGGASFVAGSTGTYTFTVSNTGTGATIGTTTVKDILPAGMSFSTPLSAGGTNGAAWACVVSTTTNTDDTATCTSTTAIAAAGTSSFTLPVSVAATAGGTTLTNRAKVFGGGDLNKAAETTTGAIAACPSDGLAGAVANAGCGFETTPITAAASLVIAKTDSETIATSGGTNSYVVTLTNQGPSVANGVILTDVVGAGLTCPAAGAVTCSVTGPGAICPASPLTIANITGAGITIATLPVNGELQFAYDCSVN